MLKKVRKQLCKRLRNSLIFGICPKSEQKSSIFGHFLTYEIQTIMSENGMKYAVFGQNVLVWAFKAQTEQLCSDFGWI